MKVACIQLSSGENYNKNFKDIIKYINQAIKNKADLIITPETSSIMSADKNNLFITFIIHNIIKYLEKKYGFQT